MICGIRPGIGIRRFPDSINEEDTSTSSSEAIVPSTDLIWSAK
jgi:hypothetical protein